MANAGYGNHESAAPQDGGGKDRPGADLGGATDRSAPGGQMAGSRSAPDAAGTGPHSGKKDPGSPTLSDDDRRDQSTPGAGALPSGSPPGGDVDPGAG
jgi:hypothetical protein